MSSSSSPDKIHFGPFEVTPQVFLRTPHSFGVVNLRPMLQGHVLVCPLKPHKRLTDLSAEETADLFTTTQRVQRMLARHYFESADAAVPAAPDAGSFNIIVQDGVHAGQTVPHVHVHVMPRIPADQTDPPAPLDEIYVKMSTEEGNVGGALWDASRPQPGGAGFPRIDDPSIKISNPADMSAEAETYRNLLQKMGDA